MLKKIVVTDTVFPNHLPESSILDGIGELTNIKWRNEEELIEGVADADALLVQMAPITPRVIDALQKCKVIARYGIGVDNIALDAAKAKGMVVCNVPDYCIEEVADHTVALTLAALRQVCEVDRQVRALVWESVLPRPVAPFGAMRFHLAGFGRIAQRVATRALGLGFRVGAYDPFVDADVMEGFGVACLSMEELFSQADVLSLHMPLRTDTRHFVSDRRLAQMKNSALLVNTSRGALIDTEALARRLTNGSIWGAALDVFEEEPFPRGHPLRSAINTLFSSHMAWYSTQSIPELQRKAAEEIRRYFKGEAVIHPVV